MRFGSLIEAASATVLGRDDDVGTECDLEAAAAADAVDCRDHRLVEILQFLHAAEAADAVVTVDFLAAGRGLQVPTGGKEPLAAAADQRHAQVRVVAEVGKYFAHAAAGRAVDCIGFRPVDDDLEHHAVDAGLDIFCAHLYSLSCPAGAAVRG